MSSLKALKNSKDNDLEMNQFATLPALKGKQFGKDVYSSLIKFKDLHDFLAIFPNVQREINPAKVKSVKRYIKSGLTKENANRMRFFSALTVTCRSTIFYDEINKRMAIDVNTSKLSINDGQHRWQSVHELLQELEQEFVNSKDEEKTKKIHQYINELQEMTIALVVFDNLSEQEQQQLFFDLNALSQRPSRSSNIKLNQTDVYSILSRKIAEQNRYLSHYGVEKDKMSIHSSNPNLVLLTTIYFCIKQFLRYETDSIEDNFEHYFDKLNTTFDKIFFKLPSDLGVKGKYMIEKSYALKGIFDFITYVEQEELNLDEDQIYEIIGSMDWTYNLEAWQAYGASPGKREGVLLFGGGDTGGRRSVFNALFDKAEALVVND